MLFKKTYTVAYNNALFKTPVKRDRVPLKQQFCLVFKGRVNFLETLNSIKNSVKCIQFAITILISNSQKFKKFSYSY